MGCVERYEHMLITELNIHMLRHQCILKFWSGQTMSVPLSEADLVTSQLQLDCDVTMDHCDVAIVYTLYHAKNNGGKG